MIQTQVHDQICHHLGRVEEWFLDKSQGLFFPVYSSFDLRDSSRKVVPVDANVFPAGFNNICQVDKDRASKMMRFYLKQEYGESCKTIVILAEEHTKNAFYWENVCTLTAILNEAGYSTKVALPKSMETMTVQSYLGHFLKIYGADRSGNGIKVNGEIPDLIICNNDFSEAYESWVKGLSCLINPPYKLGWYQRKKSHFFSHYNSLAKEFSHLIDLEPELFSIKTEVFSGLNISEESSREDLAQRVELFLQDMKPQDPKRAPFVFVKNNSGTYGLGIIQARSGEDIRNINYKSRKKMKAVKGGGSLSEVIIQEGIPSNVFSDGETAEPTIYVVGNQLVGGFLRAHRKKGPEENLNSPGAIYKRLCMADLQVNHIGCPMENVYGWVARLGVLGVANEIKTNLWLPGKTYHFKGS